MTLQAEFRDITDRIKSARRALAEAEDARLRAKRDADVAAEDLEIARRALMARSDAGTNDTVRRAYADRETIRERGRAEDAALELLEAERRVIVATSDLRCVEDERRFLELVARLTIATVADDETALAFGMELA